MTSPGEFPNPAGSPSSATSMTDALTGLANRHRLMADLEAAVGPDSSPALLAIFDIDGLEQYAHLVGDAEADVLLASLTTELAAALGRSATCYRTRSGELAALIHAPAAAAMDMLTKAVSALERDGERTQITTSFGAAILPDEVTDPTDALMLADERLYLNVNRHTLRAGVMPGVS